MTNSQLVRQQIHAAFSEVQYLIRLLYVPQDAHMRSLTLNQLWNQIAHLQFLVQLAETVPVQPPQPMMQPQPPQMQTGLPSAPVQTLPAQHSAGTQQPQYQQTMNREQLAQYNGKNGWPAYVAVNGIVYDVTNNAAWSAATHFGLSAGRDWTREFASCHAAEQWILHTLPPVGRLMN
ncbi:cytochrome b5 [Paenibacillus thiaminolyticus]|uniref:Cytochrome b5 n=2 Tax=Paenibacillus thiaminolyticus TaxID=49283 RepID=A0ABT4G3K3_PANTH|nr:cytochrome b5 domain-containing protein [Paenibacillus thiaminolyticus]MCY9538022.1 cytochrome b5 [Paenibacillus thiaminolyticus]MCY9604912.1 cytochrome b5 [Paenibacillus thiaminolyticus]MCY9610647.1 cytochrome b5 [Paenibacillus thiaminolyticus]MCY9615975.1 cytochrome b5 [Paenibacillus thiaminolyticus]MCY9622381.1 cytochrome b5 [Paenibacillus thiaminolyticus]